MVAMPSLAPAVWQMIGGLLGLIAGSFIATLVLRWTTARRITGRSSCDNCGRRLASGELVPLLSWLVLRGRCRQCRAAIPLFHPLVESAAMVIGCGATALQPDIGGIALALFGWQLLTLALLDARAFWLPHRLTGLLALTGLIIAEPALGVPLTDRLVGGVAGFGLLTAVRLGYHKLRGREGMGGGDPRLFGAIGLWIGWPFLPLVLMLAAFAGVAIGLLPLAHPDATIDWRRRRLPFGTLLALATMVCGAMLAVPLP